MIVFQEPSAELAAYQQDRTTHYMACVLRRKCPNLQSRTAVVSTLHSARFDPKAIKALWPDAVLLIADRVSVQ